MYGFVLAPPCITHLTVAELDVSCGTSGPAARIISPGVSRSLMLMTRIQHGTGLMHSDATASQQRRFSTRPSNTGGLILGANPIPTHWATSAMEGSSPRGIEANSC